ncbi:MAG: acetyl-CoA carboxylase carboxyltransferase subunit alpha [Myxococcales bacterium]|nr:acetyl-CoA carboxylase carboxyltransferase subunit alpha [Myxococcota bacterium]MDW8282469.1 acetyl-CoA carboxylase carboxyltransferase subunit alpha [Myxococcales bacterium]
MLSPRHALDFERPIVELEQKIAELRAVGEAQLGQELQQLEWKAKRLQQEVFAQLTPWQKVQLSRHPLRPFSLDYINRLVPDFFELHGDRAFRDDPAVLGGLGRWQGGQAVLLLGHQKGRGTQENLRRNFGMPRPEGYRKGRRLLEMAARLRLPVVSFIDTPGAYPGLDAEERGQAEAIAKNLEVMAGLPVPIVAVVIGEGGSGGALALGVADRILMLEYAVYSVISPEGCAAILWKDPDKAETAAQQMRMTADDLLALGVVDEVLREPPGGAHRDPDAMAQTIGAAVRRHLDELSGLFRTSVESLLSMRYAKYRALGRFSG